MILCMSGVCCNSPFPSLILLLWVLSLFFLVSLGKSLSGLPRRHSGKDCTCQCKGHKRLSWIPGSGRSSAAEKWQPTAVFLPGNSMNKGAWWATVHRVAKSWTQLSTYTHTHRFINIIPFKEPGLHFTDFFLSLFHLFLL